MCRGVCYVQGMCIHFCSLSFGLAAIGAPNERYAYRVTDLSISGTASSSLLTFSGPSGDEKDFEASWSFLLVSTCGCGTPQFFYCCYMLLLLMPFTWDILGVRSSDPDPGTTLRDPGRTDGCEEDVRVPGRSREIPGVGDSNDHGETSTELIWSRKTHRNTMKINENQWNTRINYGINWMESYWDFEEATAHGDLRNFA